MTRRAASIGFALVLLICTASGLSAAEDSPMWNALRTPGHVALLRHAIAPGTGDPPAFALDDCATQRNLSAEGRAQAVRIGERFRAHGMDSAQVLSSQWCRCLETGELLRLGPVEALPFLNSFFRHTERRNRQTQALRDWLAAQDLHEPLVLVTHQVNITALTGVYPASGEVVVLRRAQTGEISVLGSFKND